MSEHRETDRLFRSLVDAVEEYAIFTLDTEGRVQTWNTGAERIKGYEDDEIIGEHFSIFYTDGDVAAGVPADNLSEANARGSIQDEGWRLRNDGSRFWANVTITAIRDEDGRLEGYAKVTRDMTQRREDEQKLEAQADRLERQRDELESELDEVFERISDGFYALDEALRFRYVNDHAADTLGLDQSVVGSRIQDAVVLTEPFERALHEALETQEPVVLEDYYHPVDRWFSNAIYPSESGLSVYFRDVTERKRRELELQRYESSVETVWDGVTTLDEDDRFVMVNEAICEMTGYDRDELLGEPATLILDETTLEKAGRLFERVVEGELDIATMEYDLQTAAGGTIPVEARFGPYEYGEGSIGGVGVIRDVTERREAEEKLRNSEERFRNLMERSPFSIQIFDAEGRTVAVNPAWEQLWNASKEHLDDYNILEDEQLEASGVLVEIRKAFVGEHVTLPTTHYDPAESGKPGRDRWIEGYAYPLLSEDEETYEVALIHHDITERTKYRRRLEKSNARLEQFAYAASHDLQEPLRMVTSYLQLIDSRYGDTFDEDGEEFLEFAVDGATRMREMIEGLLEYSRIETEGESFESVDLNGVLDAVQQNLRVRIEESDAEITTAELPHVAGDVSQLRQLFQNLLDNAITYSGDDSPQVDISADRSSTHWIISVRDEGIGIDPAETDRIFEVFQRLHSREEYAGAGIGLALCKRIVERHGGEIWVDSEPGGGTTFSFSLPATDPRAT